DLSRTRIQNPQSAIVKTRNGASTARGSDTFEELVEAGDLTKPRGRSTSGSGRFAGGIKLVASGIGARAPSRPPPGAWPLLRLMGMAHRDVAKLRLNCPERKAKAERSPS